MIDFLSGDLFGNVVLLVTAAIIFWYTLETYRIRKRTAQNSDPIVVLGFSHNEQHKIDSMQLVNSGNSIALDITMWADKHSLFDAGLGSDSVFKERKAIASGLKHLAPGESFDISFLAQNLYLKELKDSKVITLEYKNRSGGTVKTQYKIRRSKGKVLKLESIDGLDFISCI